MSKGTRLGASMVALGLALALGTVPALAGAVAVSSPAAGNGTDGFEGCTAGIYATNRSESAIAADPTRPGRLLGLSKYFFSSSFSGSLTDWSQVYRFQLGSYDISGGAAQNQVLPGYTCVPGTSRTNWDATTDPNVAFDSTGNAYSSVLGFNYNNLENAIFVSKRPAGSSSWQQPVLVSQFFKSDHGLGRSFDKQWIAADYNAGSPFSSNVYVAWTSFSRVSGQVYFSRSTDGGQTFEPPRVVSTGSGGFNTFIYLDVDPAGTLYLEYTRFEQIFSTSGQAVLHVSRDGGATFEPAQMGPAFNGEPAVDRTNNGFTLPNTTFRDGIIDYFAASHTNPGILYIAAEQWDKGGCTPTADADGDYDVALFRSTNGGQSWTSLGCANDPATQGGTTDQFQPEVATDAAGHVAVAWYDRRADCPTSQPAPGYFTAPGAHNYCIQTALQWYDDATGSPVGNNSLLGPSWDPQQPANGPQPRGAPSPGYVSDLPHSVFNPCYNHGLVVCVTFIGDYFGLAVSGGVAYLLNVNTHPSFNTRQPVTMWSQASTTGAITAASVKPAANNYYQQMVLSTATAP